MTMEWHFEMIERAKGFIKNGQPLAPVLFMLTRNNISITDLSAFMDDKDFLSFMLKELIHKHNPDAYLLLMESWMRMFDTKDEGEKGLSKLVFDGTVQVSQLPSAQDCITVVYGNRESEKMGMITFKNKGKSVKFEPIIWINENQGEVKGRFMGLR
jgi:hypothetical protein